MTLYFAYGSNLNKRQMKWRCPKAVPIGAYYLDDARLVFRGVADVIHEKGSRAWGGIWKITPECERALDAYEGVEHGLYRKVYVTLDKPIRGEKEMMLYVMNSTGIMPPSQYYLDGIRQGYRDFGLKTKFLDDAVEASHDDNNPSHIERQRYRRKGRPPLAERPSATAKPKVEQKYDTAGKKAAGKKEPKKPNGQIDFDLRRNALCVYGD